MAKKSGSLYQRTTFNNEYVWDRYLIKAGNQSSLAWDGDGGVRGLKVDTWKLSVKWVGQRKIRKEDISHNSKWLQESQDQEVICSYFALCNFCTMFLQITLCWVWVTWVYIIALNSHLTYRIFQYKKSKLHSFGIIITSVIVLCPQFCVL